jgi:uncharacterized membrane protein
VSTSRLEAFSDGVIAIAITLLVLDLRVPEVGGGPLGGALRAQWPAYLGYATSFATIGIMWVNHHALVHTLGRVDRTFLFANLALLFGIATLPFTTSLAARWLRAGRDARLALVVYCASMMVIGLVFLALWWYIGRHPELWRAGVPSGAPRRAVRRTIVGPAAYLVAGAVAVASPVAALVICAAVAAYFVLPLSIGAGATADDRPSD